MLRFRTSGRAKPSRWLRVLAEAGRWFGDALAVEMRLPTARGELRFHCTNTQTLRRACTFFIKEQGTVAWLDRDLRDGDVLLDIGANVGIYTLYGAQLVGAGGCVFAVEPHLLNAVALVQNVRRNGFGDRVRLLTTALAESPRPAQFDYLEWRTGSSHSQLERGDGVVDAVQAAARASGIAELKLAQSVDSLLASGALTPPNVVKIDVDGIELAILAGMKTLLSSAARPRSVQVECGANDGAAIDAFLRDCGYRLDHRHTTMAGEKQLARLAGVARDEAILAIAHNAVYVPAKAD